MDFLLSCDGWDMFQNTGDIYYFAFPVRRVDRKQNLLRRTVRGFGHKEEYADSETGREIVKADQIPNVLARERV